MQDDIRAIPLFARFPQDELAILLAQSRRIALPAGDFLFHDGDPAAGFFVIVQGEIEISKTIGGQTIVLAKLAPGAFIGEIALLTGQPRTASGRATMASELLEFNKEVVENVTRSSPIAQLLLATMAERMRDTEAQIRQQEKLSALGNLAAGLAHELNNPAAANVRAARQIPPLLAELQASTLALAQCGLNPAQLAALAQTSAALIAAPPPPRLSALEQSDKEAELAEWLEERGVDDAWDLAPTLVTEGIGPAMLADLQTRMGEGTLGSITQWLASTMVLMGMARTVAQSATRISDMIKAVKAYTYMDEAPLQVVDLHDGLENTLTMLGNRLSGVTLLREYDRACPRMNVYASELNQVWTKLIENALDAMQDRGTLVLRTERGANTVSVMIIDSGRGIAPEIEGRIFEPFFSTKPMGTGLGLDSARRIVRDKHRGEIRFTSHPGETQFTVILPLSS